jgi:type I restriction enzyme, S subunit
MAVSSYSNPVALRALPSGWRVASIETLCERVTSGATPLRSNPAFFEGGTIPWFKTGELRDTWLEHSSEHITRFATEKTAVKIFPPNTVLMAMYGDGKTITSLGILRVPAATNQACCALIVDPEKCDARFLLYVLKRHRNDFIQIATGGAQRNLSGALIRRFALNVPPIEEQRAIAHILGTLDDKIELNRKQNETLEAMARALFKAWFVDFEPVRAKMEGRWQRGQSLPGLPAHLYDLFPDRLVESELGEIPEGWRVEMLGKFTNIKNGYAFKSSDWTESGVPVVKIGSVKPSFVDLNQVSFVSELLAEQKSGYRLPVGSILVGLTGYVGETGFIPPTENLPLLNQRVGKFEPKEELTAFVFACVRMPEFKVFCESKAHGSAQANISTTDLLRYPVTSPGIQVLRCFCNIAQQLFDEMLGNQGQRTTLAQLRDTLLPKLISGELRVPEAERFVGLAAA